MVQAHAEVLLVAKQLEMQGVDMLVDATPEADYQPPSITPPRVKKIAVKRGTGRDGEVIDEKMVTVQDHLAG